MASDLPVSQGQTFNIRPIASLPVESDSPAIAALQNAVKQGATDYDAIASHFMQGARDSEERQKMAAAKKERADEELIRPAKTAAKLKELEQQVAELKVRAANTAFGETIRPQTEAAARGAADLKVSSLQDVQSARDTALKAVADFNADRAKIGVPPDPQVEADVNYWLSNYDKLGPVPTTEGVLDLQALRSGLSRVGVSAANNQGHKNNLAVLLKAGQPTTNPDGTPLTPEQAAVEAAKWAGSTPKDVESHLGKIALLDEAIPALKKIQAIVNDPKIETVGPGYGQGSWVNEQYQKTKALLGGDATKYTRQQIMRQGISTGILDRIKSFAGTGVGRIMASEVALMEQELPHLNSTKENWNQWIDKAGRILQKGRTLAAQALPEGARSDIPEGETFTPSSTAPAGTSPGSSKESAVTVTSQAAYEALPHQTWYVDSKGTRAFKQ